jgi:hypothetical protein
MGGQMFTMKNEVFGRPSVESDHFFEVFIGKCEEEGAWEF